MVCFYPNLKELKKNIESIVFQVDKLIVVDNSEKPIKQDFFIDNYLGEKIEWVPLYKNMGIGFAQNVGIKKAIEQQYDGILLLDQDSNPPANMVEKLSNGIIYLLKQGIKVACLGPEIYNKNSNEIYKPILNKGLKLNEDFIEKDVLISSGKLILADAVRIIGMMDDSLFIDFVDFEWCWRARKSGYRIFITNQVKMAHMVGQKNVKIFGIYNLLIPSPIRHYYQFRNFILLIKRDYVPKYWKFKTLIERSIDLVVYSLFIPKRTKRIRYMSKGIIDGVLSKRGKFLNAE